VVVREDVALRVDDEPGPGAARLAGADLDRDDGRQHRAGDAGDGAAGAVDVGGRDGRQGDGLAGAEVVLAELDGGDAAEGAGEQAGDGEEEDAGGAALAPPRRGG
jgi:hypothetical protein